ncbi:alpha/beta fold hydrolase [Microbacterium sp. MAHUQ-60]|uniref:alpha/beta fold hydrolase n=1 Tax=unclassified Microbacterium TaxID=2609290 RepID=UPI0036100884
MHIERTGPPDGPRVVLLHGGGVAGWMWEPLRQALPADLELIIPDLPGHDRSAQDEYVSQDRTIQELRRYLDAEVGAPYAVVGFSFGAQLAVRLAAESAGAVSHVTVISAQAKPARFPALTLGLLAAAAPLARRPAFARAQAKQLFIPDSLLDDYVRTSTELAVSTLTRMVGDNIRFTIPAGWDSYTGSALMLIGRDERRVIADSARALQRKLPGSDLEIVDGCGHGIPFQRPAWLAARLAAQWTAR